MIIFTKTCDSRAVQRSALCRSRRELSNAYLLAKFGFDTFENQPCKVCPLSAYRSLRFYPGLVIVLVRAFVANAALFSVARKTERALEAVAAKEE